jgi:DNA mismatch repair protein MSH4
VILPVQDSHYHAEQAINNILIVKKFVTSVAPVFESLLPAQCTLLGQIRDTCRPEVIRPILDLINTIIDENATFVKTPLELRHQRTYAVKVISPVSTSGSVLSTNTVSVQHQWSPRCRAEDIQRSD